MSATLSPPSFLTYVEGNASTVRCRCPDVFPQRHRLCESQTPSFMQAGQKMSAAMFCKATTLRPLLLPPMPRSYCIFQKNEHNKETDERNCTFTLRKKRATHRGRAGIGGTESIPSRKQVLRVKSLLVNPRPAPIAVAAVKQVWLLAERY